MIPRRISQTHRIGFIDLWPKHTHTSSILSLRSRKFHSGQSITDPSPSGAQSSDSTVSISLSPPSNTGSLSQTSTFGSSVTQEKNLVTPSNPPLASNVPALGTSSRIPMYTNPPFHTHAFFTALEKTFPAPTARSLMRATCALLVDRLSKVRQEGLSTKDLDNVCFGPLSLQRCPSLFLSKRTSFVLRFQSYAPK